MNGEKINPVLAAALDRFTVPGDAAGLARMAAAVEARLEGPPMIMFSRNFLACSAGAMAAAAVFGIWLSGAAGGSLGPASSLALVMQFIAGGAS